jgi:tRNA (guanine-N7-)-methyltransferase
MRVRTLLNPFKCNTRFSKQEWSEIFPQYKGLLDVEIGSGNGSFLQHYATEHPSRAIVGFEIRKKWVDYAQEKITANKLTNIHLVCGNGQIGLEDMFQDNSIDRIFIFHPDPWPKQYHQKRRIINPIFLEIAQRKLKSDGLLYISTDVQDLWDYMIKTIEKTQKFEKFSDEEFWTNVYQTRWKEMCQDHQRSLFCATFKVIK